LCNNLPHLSSGHAPMLQSSLPKLSVGQPRHRDTVPIVTKPRQQKCILELPIHCIGHPYIFINYHRLCIKCPWVGDIRKQLKSGRGYWISTAQACWKLLQSGEVFGHNVRGNEVAKKLCEVNFISVIKKSSDSNLQLTTTTRHDRHRFCLDVSLCAK